MLACLVVEAGLLGVGIDDLDEGYFVQQATRVLHGQLPYRDFDTLYTPGLAFVHAGIFFVSSGPSLLGPRILAWLARAALALVLFQLARPFVRNPWWAALPGFILLIGLDNAPERWEPHPGWLSSFFAILAAWCLTQPSRRWLLLSGVAAAIAYAFKQNAGVFILGAILIWCWPRVRWPLAGFAVTTLAWLIPLLLAGTPVSQLAVIIGAVDHAGLLTSPEPTILIPLACLAAGVWLLRNDSHPHLRLYLLAGSALFLTELPRVDTLHLLWSAPLLLVIGAVALERIPRRLALLSLAATAVLLWPNLSSRVSYTALPRAPVDGVDAPMQTASDIQSTLDDIQARTQAGEPIFVYPTSPLLYVLANRPNPTRFDHLNPGAATPEQLDQVIADLHAANVHLAVISDFWIATWGPPGANAVLQTWLEQRYVEVGRHGPYRLLAAAI